MKKHNIFCSTIIFLLSVIIFTACMELYDDYEITKAPVQTGSVALDDPNLWVSATGSDSNPGTALYPFASLAKAIEKINNSPNPRDAWTINIEGNVECTTNITTQLNASTLTIRKKDGASEAKLNGNINGTSQGPILYVAGTAEIIIIIEGVDICNGSGSYGGGININNPNATITFKRDGIYGSITHCNASTHGGAVYISNGTFILDGGIIGGTTNPMYTNSANKGGGIFNNGTVNLVNTYSITNNTASESGGGIYNTSNGIIKVNGTITTGTDIANVTSNYNNSGENNVYRE